MTALPNDIHCIPVAFRSCVLFRGPTGKADEPCCACRAHFNSRVENGCSIGCSSGVCFSPHHEVDWHGTATLPGFLIHPFPSSVFSAALLARVSVRESGLITYVPGVALVLHPWIQLPGSGNGKPRLSVRTWAFCQCLGTAVRK